MPSEVRGILVAIGLAASLATAEVAAAAEHTVRALPENRFEPADISIAVGDSVTWVNDGGLHNVNAPGFFRCANGCDGEGGDGDPADNPWSFTRIFAEPATINYICEVHAGIGMFGKVVVAGGGPQLTISGDCPGEITLSLAGVTPGALQAVFWSRNEGTWTIPSGPCAGTELGLALPRLLGTPRANEAGELSARPVVPPGACGSFLQMLDLPTCAVSNVARIPESGVWLIALELISDDLSAATSITHAGDGSGRLFVALQRGLIAIVEDGKVLAPPFLDIRDRVNFEDGKEQGLVGLAFHPDYATGGRFVVVYNDLAKDSVVAEFRVSAEDPDRADPDSERLIMKVEQPDDIHNLGQLQFGPAGLLYIGSGDGGPGGDPQDRGQDLGTLHGKLLRIDIDGDDFPADDARNYAIPPGNPFVGVGGARAEIWAYGFRNPWRFGFDRATGELFIADVGQHSWEEVSLQPAGSPGGENYGWSLMEGNRCFDPPADCNDGSLTLPILEYPHLIDGEPGGCAVVGGYRYRGAAFPSLVGTYLFADLCTGKISGAREVGGNWQTNLLLDSELTPTTFGEDEAGELYLADGGVGPGAVYRVVVPLTAAGEEE